MHWQLESGRLTGRLLGSDCLLLVSGSHSSEVEHFIGNEEVSGSNPDVSTRFATFSLRVMRARGKKVQVRKVCVIDAAAVAEWSQGE